MACCNVNLDVDVIKCLSALWPMLHLSRPKAAIKKLKKEMARLGVKRDNIKNQIEQAEHEEKIPTSKVSQWLREVETLKDQVAAIEQDFQSMSCFGCYYCCSINRRTAEKLSEANELMSQAGALDPIVTDPTRPKSNIKELEKEMTRLRCKRDDIKNQIDQAEREGKIPTNEVNQWLREMETLEGQVANIEQDFRRAAEKLGEAKELMNRTGALVSIARVGPQEPTVKLPISHRPPVGIESYVKDIVGYIDSEKDQIIGVYGMGGVGKTTILNSIQQHYLKHSKFDRVIWVVASKDCQLKRLQMDIAKSLGLSTLQESDDELTCGDKLFSYLESRNCLLLLDDIWEHVDLQLLGMAHSAIERGQQQPQPQTQPRKIVVFTTRSETVSAQMKAQQKIKVKCLNSDRAWQLFEQNSDGDVLGSDGGIKFLAKELAKECAGLPLALITVARAMSGKKSWDVWNATLNQIRDKHEWTTVCLPEDSLVMYKAFKLSYDSLENDSIRECLLCCALWPEDFAIHKFEQLIPCWIGCGIIREFNVINEAFTKGCSHLEALMVASLLEYSSDVYYKDKLVKMHDVIRDMALLMVSGLEGNKRKWIVKTGIGLRHLPRQEVWQGAERASFMWNEITSLQDYGASIFPKLSMLILSENNCLTTIPPSLFASMPLLTYLDLSACSIRELPMEIGSLVELQYLNLSDNPITRLPAEFGCLGKLEYLLLRLTEIKSIPKGTISNLSMLKWLDISYIYPELEWWWDELKCFKGRHQLSVEINIYATTNNIERLNMLTNVSIWKLIIKGNDVSELPNYDLGTPQWSCNVSDNLESLSIRDVALDKLMLAAGVGRESSFRCLRNLDLFYLPLLEKISLNGVVLRNLRELYIVACPMLENVSWVLQLPCLNRLEISDCQKMKELISDVGSSNSSSSIQMLNLSSMPNLNCIANPPLLHFPYLEDILVTNCPELKKIPFGTEILKNRLKRIIGLQDWWDNLEWDDESNKYSFAPYFRPW